MMLGTPGYKRASNSGWIGMCVEFVLGEDMPDDNQDFTSNAVMAFGLPSRLLRG
jgi:hypothetical protein